MLEIGALMGGGEVDDRAPQPRRRVELAVALAVEGGEPRLALLVAELTGMGEADDISEVARCLDRLLARELLDFQLHILRLQLAKHDRLVEQSRRDHSLAEMGRQRAGA